MKTTAFSIILLLCFYIFSCAPSVQQNDYIPSNLNNTSKNLIAYYPFNGNTDDESGNGNHGIVNTAFLTEDRFGNSDSAYSFDGVYDIIEITDHSSLRVQNFTIAAWFKPSSTIQNMPNSSPSLVSKQDWSNNSGYNLASYSTNTDTMGIQLLTGASISDREEIEYPETTFVEWIFVVATYDGKYLKIYKNSTEMNSSNIESIIINHNSTTLEIGQVMEGIIDDVRIYNYALSNEEIQNLYFEDGWPI